jgi:hypothetical protein
LSASSGRLTCAATSGLVGMAIGSFCPRVGDAAVPTALPRVIRGNVKSKPQCKALVPTFVRMRL